MSKKVKEVPIQVVSFGLNLDPYMKGWITKVEEFRQVVEKNGVACASWSCEGRTRHVMHSRQLAEALPQFEFDIRYESYHCVARKVETQPCQRCGKEVPKSALTRSYDCHGIPFRLVCAACMGEIDERGFDGAAYTAADENIDYDY